MVEKNNYINQLNDCYEQEYNDYEEDEYGEDLPIEMIMMMKIMRRTMMKSITMTYTIFR